MCGKPKFKQFHISNIKITLWLRERDKKYTYTHVKIVLNSSKNKWGNSMSPLILILRIPWLHIRGFFY